jgi:hypothetical protein
MVPALALRCTVCGRWPLLGYRLSLHGEVACVTHAATARCVFCAGTHPDPDPPGWAPFGDGRLRCRRCRAGAVETQPDARRLLPVVRRQLAGMGLELPRRVRVRIVSPAAALDAAGPREEGLLLGLTERVTGRREGTHVVEISIVAGMPPAYFGRAVAHEFGHAWLALRGRAPVPDAVEEGMCELFAYAWLKRDGTPLALALRERFAGRPDPLYGGGFRAVHTAVRRHGLARVLDAVLSSGRLP